MAAGSRCLLAPVTSPTFDALAAFEAAAEDIENDLCDEKDEGEEDDRANDDALDVGHGPGGSNIFDQGDMEPDNYRTTTCRETLSRRTWPRLRAGSFLGVFPWGDEPWTPRQGQQWLPT